MALDLTHIIQTLRAEALRLDDAIAALEGVERKNAERPRTSKRGRKSMGAVERFQVAAGMKKYWARRRNEGKVATASAP